MTHIGFIGLGHMGLPMAKRLLQAGYQVIGFDTQALALNALKEAGGFAAKDVQDVAHQASIIVTMLQTSDQVHAVCLGEQGLFCAMQAGHLFIDCSTIGVEAIKPLRDAAVEQGILYLDAPVSGGVSGAEAGTLAMLMGGDASALELAHPIVACFGKKLIHTGDVGSGQAAKLCNNMILGVTMSVVSEAFVLAERLGLSPQKLHEVVRQSSGQCWIMDHYVPWPDILPNVPANEAYKPGFTSQMMFKDLKLSQLAAASVDLKTPIAAAATSLYQEASERIGALDFSAIVTCL